MLNQIVSDKRARVNLADDIGEIGRNMKDMVTGLIKASSGTPNNEKAFDYIWQMQDFLYAMTVQGI